MSAEKFGLHITDAVIIGDTFKTGQLFYHGRPQGSRFHGDTDAELRAKAFDVKKEKMEECGRAVSSIYPDDAWELRIWD